jgi:hypothetical protein
MSEDDSLPQPTREELLEKFPSLPAHLCCQPQFEWLNTAFELWANGEGGGWSLRALAAHAREIGFEIGKDCITRHFNEHIDPEIREKIQQITSNVPLDPNGDA